jgi:hypothetical protein
VASTNTSKTAKPTEETADDNSPNTARIENSQPFSDADLRSVTSFDEALELAQREYGDVLDATDEIGAGFVELKDKSRLVDVPFVILSFTINEGDFRNEHGQLQYFCACRVVTRSGDKYWFTDGGTGIYQQLEDLAVRSRRMGGILVPRGLRESKYEWTDEYGNQQPGITHYLNV